MFAGAFGSVGHEAEVAPLAEGGVGAVSAIFGAGLALVVLEVDSTETLAFGANELGRYLTLLAF